MTDQVVFIGGKGDDNGARTSTESVSQKRDATSRRTEANRAMCWSKQAKQRQGLSWAQPSVEQEKRSKHWVRSLRVGLMKLVG